MIPIEHEDWNELIEILRNIDQNLASAKEGKISPDQTSHSRQMLQAFHTTAAMFGLQDLEQTGISLERHLEEEVREGAAEGISRFLAALALMRQEMEKTADGAYETLKFSAKVNDILQGTSGNGKDRESTPSLPDAGTEKSTEPPASASQHRHGKDLDYEALHNLVNELGGELVFSSEPQTASDGFFYLRFQAAPEKLERIQTIFSFCSAESKNFGPMQPKDSRIEGVLQSIKEFMTALSHGDLQNAQNILGHFSEKKEAKTELFVEIGTLARDLHNSLKSFATTIDPALKELVEDRLPDSGSRLEHILHLTEKAANTTLDHVELAKKRNDMDLQKLSTLEDIHHQLKAIGKNAQEKLASCQKILNDLKESASQTGEDLTTIITAQDYQDLTGQIIMKIINLLNELQLKLVNLVRTFGIIHEDRKVAMKDELYGPAHQGLIEALHSQDDVDNLLAEFGF